MNVAILMLTIAAKMTLIVKVWNAVLQIVAVIVLKVQIYVLKELKKN